MKVLHVAYSDLEGGASRAAYRVHRSLVEHGEKFGVQSKMRVIRKISQDMTVNGYGPSGISFFWRLLRPSLLLRYYRGFTLGKRTSFSVAWPKTGLGNEINDTDIDIVNLHWLGNNTLSIEEIGKIKHPVVWRLPDMWAFCGAEHYVTPPPYIDERFSEGYFSSNRPLIENGIDLNKIVWKRKIKSWNKPMHIVCPSNWLANCVKRSVIMKGWSVSVIPSAIDLEKWKPYNKSHGKDILGLSPDVKFVLFGAMGGTNDPRKGADLLMGALQKLKFLKMDFNVELLVFGQDLPDKPYDFGFPVHYFGHLYDDLSLALLYSVADVLVVPSRQDNLPGTAIESLACATPVVAFDIGGLSDLVLHQKNGWLSPAFDLEDMANGILWVLESESRHQELASFARKRSLVQNNPNTIAAQYLEVYKKVLKESVVAL